MNAKSDPHSLTHTQHKRRFAGRQLTRLLAILAVMTVLGATVVALGGFSSPASNPSTDDAYIHADTTLVSSRVPGYISQVLVSDNQKVHAGQLLATLDDHDLRVALAYAKAQAGAAQARLDQASARLTDQQTVIAGTRAKLAAVIAQANFARSELARYRALARRGAGSVQQAQRARSQVDTTAAAVNYARTAVSEATHKVDVLTAMEATAANNLTMAQANIAKASLRLSYTRIHSPIDGVVTERTLRKGAFVAAGYPLLAVVPRAQAYVSGNFRETQLADIQVNQPVKITVDALPGVQFRGHVNSIAPATGLSLSPIRPTNATGNFTKVVQRIPVKITLDRGQPQVDRLRIGMSVVATIDTESEHHSISRQVGANQ